MQRDHILLYRFPQPYPCIEPALDNIDQGIFGVQFDRQMRVQLRKMDEDWRQTHVEHKLRHGKPQQPRYLAASCRNSFRCLGNIVQRWSHGC